MLFRSPPPRFRIPKNPRNLKSAQFLAFATTPLLFSVFAGVAMSIVEGLALALLYGLSIWLLTQGLRAEQAYNEAKVARKPKLPLKLMAAGMMALAVGATVYFRLATFTEAALVGAVAAGLFVTAFGIDPLKNKGVTGPLAEETLRAHDAVKQAEQLLDQIEARISDINDTGVTAGFNAFHQSALRLFSALQDDPERHRDLRRHLGVYLEAALEATDRFAILHAGLADETSKTRYLGMLKDLADQFDARARIYVSDGKSKLEVEIDVLQSRLATESRRI